MGAQPGAPPGYARLYDNELDATGAGMSLADPHAEAELYVPPDETSPSPTAVGNPTNLRGVGCSWNGMPTACGFLMALIAEKAGGVANFTRRLEINSVTISSVVGHFLYDGQSSTQPDGTERVEVATGRDITYTATYHQLSERVTASMSPAFGYGAGFMTGVEPRRASPQETYPGVLGNIRFVASDGTAVGDNQQRIIGQIQNMAFSRGCTEAFRKAGLATPDELVQKGLIIGPASALNNPGNNAAFGISEAQRKQYKDLTTTSNPLLFIGGLTVQGKDFSDGRARIWFTADGVRKAFTETVIHEMMHAAGAGRYSAWTGHDLKNFKQNGVTYQDMIVACSKR